MNTKVTIEINSAEHSAKVSQQFSDSRVAVKNIPVSELPELIRLSASNTMKDNDTGFISPNLIREVTAHGQIRRLYHYPTIKFDCRLRAYEFEEDDISFNASNSYGITEDDEHIVFPGFTYRNFGLLITNVNNEEFSGVRHNFGCISTDFFDQVSNESLLYYAMLNHFDQKVCWHGSFDHSLLSERNSVKQGKLAYHYLNSNFNNDLYLRCVPSDEAINKYGPEGLHAFLKDVFSAGDVDDILNARDNSCGYIINVAILYFLCTKLNLKFEDVTQANHSYDSDSETYLSIRDYF